jgi:LuxR family maltose regulon positive regulatory protein
MPYTGPVKLRTPISSAGRSRRPRKAPEEETIPWSVRHRLQPPTINVVVLQRPHLFAGIEAPLPGGVTVLAAPAGFGKTVLASLLYERLGRQDWRCAWLSVGPEHANAGELRRDLRSALLRINIAVSASRSQSLTDGDDPSYEYEVLDALDRSPSRVALFIDGLESIDQSISNKCLARLLQELPPRVHMVLISRKRSSIDVGRHQVAGRVAELTASHLRLNEEEAETLFREVSVRSRVDETLSWLDGWPVAIQLVRHFLMAAPTASRFASLFAEGVPALNSYIDDYILGTLSERTREFLACAAELQTEAAELIDVARGRRDRHVVQTELAEYAPLIRVSSDAACLFQAHPAISARLLRLPVINESRQDLHRRAADCLIGTRDAAGAIRHLVAAGETTRAATLVDDVGLFKLAGDIGPRQLSTLLRFLPTSALKDLPRARAVWISTLLNEGRHDEAQAEYHRLQADVRDMEPSRCAALHQDLSILEEYFKMLDDDLPSVEEVDRVGKSAPVTQDPAAVLWRQQRGEFGRARDEIEELFGVFSKSAGRFNLAGLQTYRGLIAFGMGNLEEAEQAHLAASALDPGRAISMPSLMIDIPRAEVFYERDGIETASEILEDHAGCPEYLDEWFDIYVARHTIAARILTARGEVEKAISQLRSCAKLAEESRLHARHAVLVATAVEILLQTGHDPSITASIANQLPNNLATIGPPETLPWRLVEMVSLTRARLALAEGDSRTAHGLADALALQWDSLGLVRGSIRSRLIAAAALSRIGSDEQAVSRISEAMSLAHQTQHLRVLLDERSFLAALLTYFLQSPMSRMSPAPLLEWIILILRRLGLEQRIAATGSPLSLSARERDVLMGLSQGHTNKTIARTYGITVNTVKHHLRHVYKKLKVQRRVQAVEEARRRSFIP